MTARRRIDRKVVRVLIVGFSLTIVLLLVSGFVGIQAIEIVEERSAALHERQRVSTRLIDEIQGEEAGLSNIFYALATGPRPVDRVTLLRKLDGMEAQVSKTLRTAFAGPEATRWAGVHVAVDEFIAEVRRLLQAPGDRVETPPSLYRAHENLAGELSNLVTANYQAAVAGEAQFGLRGHERMRHSLFLLGVALLLAVGCAAATVLIVMHMFHRTEWQAGELSRLSGHVLDTQEQMLRRFSRELHDEFGQTLTAIEANLAAVPRTSPAVAARIEDCSLLVKDAMASVREISQLLRPSTLDDFGLAASLQWLSDSFSQRTGIQVDLQVEFHDRLSGETETHLFRIAQEALTNVARHSGASRADLVLRAEEGMLRLKVSDNGRGLPHGGPRRGFGLMGMRERMRAAGGQVEIRSDKKGVTVVAEVPLDGIAQEANPSFVGG
jgi:signal transduction histidine kinase